MHAVLVHDQRLVDGEIGDVVGYGDVRPAERADFAAAQAHERGEGNGDIHVIVVIDFIEHGPDLLIRGDLHLGLLRLGQLEQGEVEADLVCLEHSGDEDEIVLDGLRAGGLRAIHAPRLNILEQDFVDALLEDRAICVLAIGDVGADGRGGNAGCAADFDILIHRLAKRHGGAVLIALDHAGLPHGSFGLCQDGGRFGEGFDMSDAGFIGIAGAAAVVAGRPSFCVCHIYSPFIVARRVL